MILFIPYNILSCQFVLFPNRFSDNASEENLTFVEFFSLYSAFTIPCTDYRQTKLALQIRVPFSQKENLEAAEE